MNRPLVSLMLLCTTWFLPPLVSRADYLITTLNSPDPTNQKVDANGISPAGVVVGDFVDSGGTYHAYTYSPQTAIYTTYNYPGAVGTYYTGLNNSGQLVGVYLTASSSFGFLVINGVAQKIAPFSANQSVAYSINNSGQIVGAYVAPGHGYTGYIGDPTHGYTIVQSPLGTQYALGNGLNDAGEVVGNYADSSGIQHGFFATKPNYLAFPLDYPGANFTIAQGINSAGTIAGDFSDDGGATTHGFLDTNGVFTQFDVPGSKPGSTFVGSINDAGQLVGSYVPIDGTQLVGFLATPAVSTWTGTASANWVDIGNWSGAVAGAPLGTTNAATAIFSKNAPSSPLTIDSGRNLQNITFDTAAVNSLTIGTVSGPSLLLTASGTIQTTSTVTELQTVNAPLVLEGSYTLTSGASSGSATLNFGGGITPTATSGITTLTLNGGNTGANTISGILADNGSGQLAVTKDGAGLWVLSGANTYSGNTTVLAGTLKFNLTSGSSTIAAGVTATVASGATLELAGSISALGTAGGNRVHIVNNSTASGVVVSGTNQVVGAIDGAGNVQVVAGSDLTADHIIQTALIIGGVAGSPALVTIDASDSSGNPLGRSNEFALAGLLTPSAPFGTDGISSAPPSSSDIADLAAQSAGNPAVGGNPSPVPEPSTLLLALLAVLGLVSTQFARHRFRWQTV